MQTRCEKPKIWQEGDIWHHTILEGLLGVYGQPWRESSPTPVSGILATNIEPNKSLISSVMQSSISLHFKTRYSLSCVLSTFSGWPLSTLAKTLHGSTFCLIYSEAMVTQLKSPQNKKPSLVSWSWPAFTKFSVMFINVLHVIFGKHWTLCSIPSTWLISTSVVVAWGSWEALGVQVWCS